MVFPRILAGVIAGLLALAGAASAQTPEPPAPPPTVTPPTLPAGCFVTSAGLQCPQLPAGCVVTSAGLVCPPGTGVAGESATNTTNLSATGRSLVSLKRRKSSPPPRAVSTGAAPLRELPFTGLEVGHILLLGAALLGAGLVVRRRAAPS